MQERSTYEQAPSSASSLTFSFGVLYGQETGLKNYKTVDVGTRSRTHYQQHLNHYALAQKLTPD